MPRKVVFNIQIENLNTIREVLRYIFIYGCYTREDFGRMNISGRKYDNEARRIREFVNQDQLRERRVGKKKQLSMGYEYYVDIENYLMNSYQAKSFKRNDIVLYFLIQQAFSSQSSPMDKTSLHSFFIDRGIPGFDDNTLERKLRELNNVGIIKRQLRGKKYVYLMPEDFFAEFSTDELVEIERMVDFFAKTACISVPGYYLRDTIHAYLKQQRGKVTEQNLFVYRHSNFHPVLDEEIVWQLLQMVQQKKFVNIIYKNRYHRQLKLKTYPLRLLFHREYGHWYLIGDSGFSNLSTYRVDRIEGVEVLSENQTEQAAQSKLQLEFAQSWRIAAKQSTGELKRVRVRFSAENETTLHMLRARVQREGEWGILSASAGLTFTYEISVTDEKEILPWIRSFGYRAEVLADPSHSLRVQIQEDWEAILENYV